MRCLYKGKQLCCYSLYTLPIQCFSLLFEGQLHKENNLGIMTNVGKNRLVKVTFINIQKTSDVCGNSFGRYIMIAQLMRDVFTFYYIQVSLEKWCF